MDHGGSHVKFVVSYFMYKYYWDIKGDPRKAWGNSGTPRATIKSLYPTVTAATPKPIWSLKGSVPSTAPPHRPPLKFCRFHGLGETQLVIQIKSNKTGPPAIVSFSRSPSMWDDIESYDGTWTMSGFLIDERETSTMATCKF